MITSESIPDDAIAAVRRGRCLAQSVADQILTDIHALDVEGNICTAGGVSKSV